MLRPSLDLVVLLLELVPGFGGTGPGALNQGALSFLEAPVGFTIELDA